MLRMEGMVIESPQISRAAFIKVVIAQLVLERVSEYKPTFY